MTRGQTSTPLPTKTSGLTASQKKMADEEEKKIRDADLAVWPHHIGKWYIRAMTGWDSEQYEEKRAELKNLLMANYPSYTDIERSEEIPCLKSDRWDVNDHDWVEEKRKGFKTQDKDLTNEEFFYKFSCKWARHVKGESKWPKVSKPRVKPKPLKLSSRDSIAESIETLKEESNDKDVDKQMRRNTRSMTGMHLSDNPQSPSVNPVLSIWSKGFLEIHQPQRVGARKKVLPFERLLPKGSEGSTRATDFDHEHFLDALRNIGIDIDPIADKRLRYKAPDMTDTDMEKEDHDLLDAGLFHMALIDWLDREKPPNKIRPLVVYLTTAPVGFTGEGNEIRDKATSTISHSPKKRGHDEVDGGKGKEPEEERPRRSSSEIPLHELVNKEKETSNADLPSPTKRTKMTDDSTAKEPPVPPVPQLLGYSEIKDLNDFDDQHRVEMKSEPEPELEVEVEADGEFLPESESESESELESESESKGTPKTVQDNPAQANDLPPRNTGDGSQSRQSSDKSAQSPSPKTNADADFDTAMIGTSDPTPAALKADVNLNQEDAHMTDGDGDGNEPLISEDEQEEEAEEEEEEEEPALRPEDHDHSTRGMTATIKQKRSSVFPLPYDWQEKKVLRNYRQITLEQLDDDEKLQEICDFDQDQDLADIFSLEKFTIIEGKKADEQKKAADQRKAAKLAAGAKKPPPAKDKLPANAGEDPDDFMDEEDDVSGPGKRGLEHFTAKHFRDFIAFFRLDVNGLMLHSRTKFNFPGTSRTPYLQQLYISLILFEKLMDVGVAILGDRPGIGKSTIRELIYIIWVHLDNVRRDIEADRARVEEAAEQGVSYTARHLPGDATEGVCPTEGEHIYQCPCNPDAVFGVKRVAEFAGFRLDINAKNQLVTPGIKEWLQMQRTDTHSNGTPWWNNYKNRGIGETGPFRFIAHHGTELKSLSIADQKAVKPLKVDFDIVKPTFVEAESGVSSEYNANRILDAYKMRKGTWTYTASPTAKNLTLTTTPHFVSEKGLGHCVWDSKRFYGPSGLYYKKRRTLKLQVEHSGVKPGMLTIDEWHQNVGTTKACMDTLINDFKQGPNGGYSSTKHTWGSNANEAPEQHYNIDVRDVPITRVLLMSGTPLSNGAPLTAKNAAKLIENQLNAFCHADDRWSNPGHKYHFLSSKVLNKSIDQVKKISDDMATVFKNALKAQGTAGKITEVSQQISGKFRKQLAYENSLAKNYLLTIMAQRDTSSKMFHCMLGIPVKIVKRPIYGTTEQLERINKPALSKKEIIEEEIAKFKASKSAKSGDRDTGTTITKVFMNDASVRIAGALPGYESVREEWSKSETARLNQQLKEGHDQYIRWPKTVFAEDIRWSDLETEENRQIATLLTWHNGEMDIKKMLTTWPNRPTRFFEENYRDLLEIRDTKDRPVRLRHRSSKPTTKFEMFYKWVWAVLHGTDPKNRPACGFLASLSIVELETFRAAACFEFGNEKSPWFIQKDIDREMFAIYTRNWDEGNRPAAVEYITGEPSEAFESLVFKNRALVEQHPWLKQEEWGSMERRPRFLLGSGVMAEGISATRFSKMAMIEPFHQKAKITQMASRIQRINSEFRAEIDMWVMMGSFYDTLAFGAYKGPMEQTAQIQQLKGAININEDLPCASDHDDNDVETGNSSSDQEEDDDDSDVM